MNDQPHGAADQSEKPQGDARPSAVRFAPSEDPIAGAVSRLNTGLLWPKLLAVPRLALVPGSIGLALFATVLLALVDTVSMALMPVAEDGAEGRGMLAAGLDAVADAAMLAAEGVLQGQLHDLTAAGATLAGYASFAAAHPLNAVATAVPAAFIAAIFGSAIARTAAVDIGVRQRIGWTEALAYGLGAAKSGGPALLAVPGIAALAALLLAVAGWVLLSLPGLNIVGAVFYGLMLLIGAIATFALIGFIAAAPLMLPAIACDAADSFDAVQRAYAYAVARPLRLIGYLAVSTIAGALLIGLLTALATAALEFTSTAAWAFADPAGERIDAIESGDASGTWWFVHMGISFWRGLVYLLVASVGVSYFFSASTVVYLLIRQVVDGQHHTEIHVPGPVGPRVREPVENDD